MIETRIGVKRTLQPLSQSCATETKTRSFKLGKRYASRADNSNQGRSSVAVYVACMTLLSDKLTEYGIRYDLLLVQGMLIGVQWWEAPGSTIATLISVHTFCLCRFGGGIVVLVRG